MKLLLSILSGSVMFFVISVLVAAHQPIQVQAKISESQTPSPTRHYSGSTAWPTPTRQPTATLPAATPKPAIAAGGMQFGMAGQLQCWNCAPFNQRIKLSSYDPMNYDPDYPQMNCYDYHDGYCWSPTASGIPWKAVWGFGAACPPDWPYGTWVEIETVGTFICLDRGNEIKCTDGICNVDLLGPGGSWNGLEFDATLWVPLQPK